MKISILGSGSEGNSIYIEHNGVGILVDAGFSAKMLCERLDAIGVQPQKIAAILITHEHVDHLRGAGTMARKFGIPIYITRESHDAGTSLLGKTDNIEICMINNECFTVVPGLAIIPFDVSHDAFRTLGYRIESNNGECLAISTDIGMVDDSVKPYLKDAEVLVLESNYDPEMLKNCGYPYPLKARIGSDKGHLSNNRSAETIAECYSDRLKKVYLAHVSKNSNTYAVAAETTRNMLDQLGLSVELEVALQNRPTEMFVF